MITRLITWKEISTSYQRYTHWDQNDIPYVPTTTSKVKCQLYQILTSTWNNWNSCTLLMAQENVTATSMNCFSCSHNAKHTSVLWPSNTFLDIYSREMKTHPQDDRFKIWCHIHSSSILGAQPKRSPKKIMKLLHVHTMNTAQQLKKSELWIEAATWINF